MAKLQDRIKELEHQLSTTKYNKATEKAFGVMKAQLARVVVPALGNEAEVLVGQGQQPKL